MKRGSEEGTIGEDGSILPISSIRIVLSTDAGAGACGLGVDALVRRRSCSNCSMRRFISHLRALNGDLGLETLCQDFSKIRRIHKHQNSCPKS